jgi:DUF296 family protein family protein
MRSKSINDGLERTFVLILDQGEDAFKSITDFADREKISGASGFRQLAPSRRQRSGWFDLAAKKYKPIEVGEQCEVLSLIGDEGARCATVRPRVSEMKDTVRGQSTRLRRSTATEMILCRQQLAP